MSKINSQNIFILCAFKVKDRIFISKKLFLIKRFSKFGKTDQEIV